MLEAMFGGQTRKKREDERVFLSLSSVSLQLLAHPQTQCWLKGTCVREDGSHCFRGELVNPFFF